MRLFKMQSYQFFTAILLEIRAYSTENKFAEYDLRELQSLLQIIQLQYYYIIRIN